MQQRVAIAWVLLVLVGLLLGLLVAVLAVGVSRHVRRARDGSTPRRNPKRHADEDDGDEISHFSRREPPEDDTPTA